MASAKPGAVQLLVWLLLMRGIILIIKVNCYSNKNFYTTVQHVSDVRGTLGI